jgi:hypothetical protein
MRRALVLSDETARHPFRLMLPANRIVIIDPAPGEFKRLFWMTFFAGFLAFYGFLS